MQSFAVIQVVHTIATVVNMKTYLVTTDIPRLSKVIDSLKTFWCVKIRKSKSQFPPL